MVMLFWQLLLRAPASPSTLWVEGQAVSPEHGPLINPGVSGQPMAAIAWQEPHAEPGTSSDLTRLLIPTVSQDLSSSSQRASKSHIACISSDTGQGCWGESHSGCRPCPSHSTARAGEAS